MPATLEFAPRLMVAAQAAHYLGVSVSKLLTLGIPRRQLGSKRLYDRLDLDAYASDLPYEGERDEVAECDILFGVQRRQDAAGG